MSTETLIEEIEAFANERNLAPATVVSRAADNGRLYGRLKSGFGCTLKTAERIRAFIASERAAQTQEPISTPTSEPQHDPASSDPA